MGARCWFDANCQTLYPLIYLYAHIKLYHIIIPSEKGNILRLIYGFFISFIDTVGIHYFNILLFITVHYYMCALSVKMIYAANNCKSTTFYCI